MKARLGVGVEVDTDAISPECLKAAFDVTVDRLFQRANEKPEGAVALDWSTLEFALHSRADNVTHVVLRAEIL